MRLRRPKSSADGPDKSNNECPSPAHLVVSKEQNVGVIDSEVHWHEDYEQIDKTVELISRQPWHGPAEDEGYSNYDCAPNGNSDKDR